MSNEFMFTYYAVATAILFAGTLGSVCFKPGKLLWFSICGIFFGCGMLIVGGLCL